ncbi:MAG TPA: YcnI family protein [Nevskiales bacterium]|nr:YcnI family protein [Nevskiales bacterium]
MTSLRPGLAGLLMFAHALAIAHVTLEQPSAPAGSHYKAVFRVGHGCAGSPTIGLTVTLPPGVTGAKPMPKPGWSLATRIEKLAVPYRSHGRTITEDVAAVSWRGGPLPDAHYDEFVIRLRLPEAPGPLYFKVAQFCERGRIDWADIPAEGRTLEDYKTPAAVLEVLPADAPAHH